MIQGLTFLSSNFADGSFKLEMKWKIPDITLMVNYVVLYNYDESSEYSDTNCKIYIGMNTGQVSTPPVL